MNHDTWIRVATVGVLAALTVATAMVADKLGRVATYQGLQTQLMAVQTEAMVLGGTRRPSGGRTEAF